MARRARDKDKSEYKYRGAAEHRLTTPDALGRVRPDHGNTKWTTEDLANVLAEYLAMGERATARDVAAKLGMPYSTVRDWIDAKRDMLQELTEIRNLEFIETIDAKISNALRLLDETKLGESTGKELAVIIGVLLDKRAMLLGPSAKQAGKLSYQFNLPSGSKATVAIEPTKPGDDAIDVTPTDA